MTAHRTNNKNKGFILIELIAGVLIVGLVILIINNLPNSLRLIGNSRRAAIAQQIAAKEIEDLRATSYANLAYTNSPVAVSDPRINQLPSGSLTYQIKTCPGLAD